MLSEGNSLTGFGSGVGGTTLTSSTAKKICNPEIALALKDPVRPGYIRDPAPGELFQRIQWQRDTLPTPFHRNV
jgi:hypothetical protein